MRDRDRPPPSARVAGAPPPSGVAGERERRAEERQRNAEALAEVEVVRRVPRVVVGDAVPVGIGEFSLGRMRRDVADPLEILSESPPRFRRPISSQVSNSAERDSILAFLPISWRVI